MDGKGAGLITIINLPGDLSPCRQKLWLVATVPKEMERYRKGTG
jgi:hypothetical protein